MRKNSHASGRMKSTEIQKRSDGFNMMVKDVQHGKTTRKSFARIEEILEMPNLIEIQKKSYEWFLATGLREVFEDVSAITDYTGNLELTFLDYSLDEPKYSIEECKARAPCFTVSSTVWRPFSSEKVNTEEESVLK